MVDQGPLPWSAMSVVARAPVRMFTYHSRPQDPQQYIGPMIFDVPELASRAVPSNVLGMDQHSYIGVLWGACNELLNMIEPLQEAAGDLPGITAASTVEHQRLQGQLDALKAELEQTAGGGDVDARLTALQADVQEMGARLDTSSGGFDTTQAVQDEQLHALQAWTTQHGTEVASTLSAFRDTLNGLSTRVGVLEGWRGAAAARLDAVEAADGAARTRLDAVEGAGRSQGARLDALETQRGAVSDQLAGMQATVDNARASADQASAAASAANSTANGAQVAAAAATATASSAAGTASAAQSGVSALQTRASALEARAPRLWQAVGNLPLIALGATADVVCTWLSTPAMVPTVGQCVPIVGVTLGSTTAPVVKAVSASTVTVTVKAGLAVTATTGAVSVIAATN